MSITNTLTRIPMLFEETAATETQQGNFFTNLISSQWFFWVMLVVIIGVFYFVVLRPQKKQQREQDNMRNSLRVGDEITTIGGIVGRVVRVREDTFTIITSKERTRLTFKRSALSSIDKKADEPVQEAPADTTETVQEPEVETTNVETTEEQENTEKTE